ncbi:MAG: efflux RND transporter periplasmic adaptor subunit [Candidatus Brocadiaceae bacterium]|nr:efflux RND transporter periplasmic adaptor subunit [Candidatus Brocadiaceae bacterium]
MAETATPREKPIRKVERKRPADVHEKGVVRMSKASYELLGLETVKVEKRSLGKQLKVTAEIQFNANKVFHIGPRVPGRAVDVFADLGDEVQKGQKLALLDSIELGQSISEYLTSKTKLEVCQVNFEREKRLWEKKVTSEKDMLEAKARCAQAQAEFEASEGKLHLLGLCEEEIIELRPQTHTTATFPILSPFNGTIVEKHIALGEMTEPASRLFTIADLSVLWIILDIFEKDLSKIRPGQEVGVAVRSYPEVEFRGKITYISDVVEEKTRTVKVRVEIDNPEKKLKPGMFATAKISTTPQEAVERRVAPHTAIESHEGKQVVFVVLGDYAFKLREVEVGEELDGYVEVFKGLGEGEEIVSKGAFYLKSELLKGAIVHEH